MLKKIIPPKGVLLIRVDVWKRADYRLAPGWQNLTGDDRLIKNWDVCAENTYCYRVGKGSEIKIISIAKAFSPMRMGYRLAGDIYPEFKEIGEMEVGTLIDTEDKLVGTNCYVLSGARLRYQLRLLYTEWDVSRYDVEKWLAKVDKQKGLCDEHKKDIRQVFSAERTWTSPAYPGVSVIDRI